MQNQYTYASNAARKKPFANGQEQYSNEKSIDVENEDIMDEEVEEIKGSRMREEYHDYEEQAPKEREPFRIDLPAQFESFEEFAAFIGPELREAARYLSFQASGKANSHEEEDGGNPTDAYNLFDFYGAILKGILIPQLHEGSLVFHLSGLEGETMDEQTETRFRNYIREDFMAMIGKRKGRSLENSRLKFNIEDNDSVDVNIQLNKQELFPMLADLVQRYEGALQGRSDTSYGKSYFEGIMGDDNAVLEEKVYKLMDGLTEYFGEGQDAERMSNVLGGSFELVPIEQDKLENNIEEEKDEGKLQELELCQRLIDEYNRPEEFIQCNPENSSIMFAMRLFDGDKVSNCSIHTVILAYLVFQLRVKRVIEELSDSSAVEELIQTARFIPFPSSVHDLQNKLVVAKALDLMMEPELENCMPHSSYNNTLKRFSEDTHQMNVEALNLCLSFCDLYYLEHCLTSSEVYTRLNIYRQQLDALVSTYNCCNEEMNNQKTKNAKAERIRFKQMEAVFEKAKQIIGFDEYPEFEFLMVELNKASNRENNELEMREEENIELGKKSRSPMIQKSPLTNNSDLGKKSKSPLVHRSPLANVENSPQIKMKNKMEVEKPQEPSDIEFSFTDSGAKSNNEKIEEQHQEVEEEEHHQEEEDAVQEEEAAVEEEEMFSCEDEHPDAKMELENHNEDQPEPLNADGESEAPFWVKGGENFFDKPRTSRELELFLNEAPKSVVESIGEDALHQLYDDLEKAQAWKKLHEETFETDIEDYIRSKFESELKDPAQRNRVFNVKSKLDQLNANFSEELEKYPDLQHQNQLIQKYLDWFNWSFRVEETISSIEYGAKIASFGDLKELFSEALKFEVPKSMEFYQRVEHWHDAAYDLLREYRAKFENEKLMASENNLAKSLEKDSVKRVIERLRNRPTQVEALKMREELENKSSFVSFSEEIERITQALEDYEKWQSKLDDLLIPASRRLIELAKEKDDMSTDHEQIGQQIGEIKNDFAFLSLRNEEDEFRLNSLEWQYRTFLLMKKLNKEANAEEWKKLTKYSTEHPDIDPSAEKIFANFLTQEMSNWKKYQKIVKSLKKKEKSNELQSHEDVQKLLNEMKAGSIKLPGDEKFLEELLLNSKALVTRAYRLINTNEKTPVAEFNKVLEQIKQFPITLKAEEQQLEAAIEKANRLASLVRKSPALDIPEVEKTFVEYRQCPILISEVVKLQQNFEDSKKTSHKVLLEALKLNDNSSMTFGEIQNLSQKVDAIKWDHDGQLGQAKLKVFTQKIQILQKLSNSKAETQTKITMQMLKNFVDEGQTVKKLVVETPKLNQALFWIESLLRKAEEKVTELDSVKSIEMLDRMPKVMLGIIDYSAEIEKRRTVLKSAPQPKPTEKESKPTKKKMTHQIKAPEEEEVDENELEWTDAVFRRKSKPAVDAVGPIKELLEKNENLILSGKEAKDIAEKLVGTFKLVKSSSEKLGRFLGLLKNVLRYPNIARDLVEKKFDAGEVKYWLKRNDDELLLRDRRLEDPFKKAMKPSMKEPELVKRVHSGDHLKNMLENSNSVGHEVYLSDNDETMAVDLTQKSRNTNSMFRDSLMRSSKDDIGPMKVKPKRVEAETKAKPDKLERILNEDALAENLSLEEKKALMKLKAAELKKENKGKEDLDASSIFKIFDGALKTTEDKMTPEVKLFSCDPIETIEEIPEINDPLVVQGRMTLQKFTPLFNKILNAIDSEEHLVISGWVVAQTADYQASCERIAQNLAHAHSIGVAKYLDNAKIFFMHRDQIPIQWEKIFHLESKMARKISQYALLTFVLVYKPIKVITPSTMPLSKIVPVPLSSLQDFVKPKSNPLPSSYKAPVIKIVQKASEPVKSKPMEPKRAHQTETAPKSKPAESRVNQKTVVEPKKVKPIEAKPLQKSNEKLKSAPIEPKTAQKVSAPMRTKPLEPATIKKPTEMSRSSALEPKRAPRLDETLRKKPQEPKSNQSSNEKAKSTALEPKRVQKPVDDAPRNKPLVEPRVVQKRPEPMRPKLLETKRRAQDIEDLLDSPRTPDVQSLDGDNRGPMQRKDSLSFDEFDEFEVEEPLPTRFEQAKPKPSKPPVINILPEFINMDASNHQMGFNNQGNSNSFRSFESGSNRNKPVVREMPREVSREQMRPRTQPTQNYAFDEPQDFDNEEMFAEEMYDEEMEYQMQMRPNPVAQRQFNSFSSSNKPNFQRNPNPQVQYPREPQTHNEQRRLPGATHQMTSAPSLKDFNLNNKRIENTSYPSRIETHETGYPKQQQQQPFNRSSIRQAPVAASHRNAELNGPAHESHPNPYYLEYLKSRTSAKQLSSSPVARTYLGYSPEKSFDNRSKYDNSSRNIGNNHTQSILEEDDNLFERRPTFSSFNRPTQSASSFNKPTLNQRADSMSHNYSNNSSNKFQSTANKFQNASNQTYKTNQNVNITNTTYKSREVFTYSAPMNPTSNKAMNNNYPKFSTFQTAKKW